MEEVKRYALLPRAGGGVIVDFSSCKRCNYRTTRLWFFDGLGHWVYLQDWPVLLQEPVVRSRWQVDWQVILEARPLRC
jgi:hypothetical protein